MYTKFNPHYLLTTDAVVSQFSFCIILFTVTKLVSKNNDTQRSTRRISLAWRIYYENSRTRIKVHFSQYIRVHGRCLQCFWDGVDTVLFKMASDVQFVLSNMSVNRSTDVNINPGSILELFVGVITR